MLMQTGPPPPTMAANQLTPISQPGTSVAGGVTVMQGHVVQTPGASAGTPAIVSGGNMMPMSMASTTIANSTPYQFPITSPHTSTTSIQPTPGYPANGPQTIIYVS